MSERERLVELLLESGPIKERDLDDDWGDNEISDIAEHLLENGVVVLPCKIGTEVYGVSTPCGGCEYYNNSSKEALNTCRCCKKKEVINFGFSYDCIGEFGKTVFLTKEEAEAALRKE